jgi:ribose transport system substrate-binding protein
MTIAFVPKASDNLVFRVAFQGAKEAATELSVDGFKVEMKCWSPVRLDPRKQAEAVAKAIASQPTGLLVSCLDASTQSLKNAVKDGLPVMTFDSDCLSSDRMAFCGMDNAQTGMDAAIRLVKAMSPMGDGAKRVAILTGRASENLNAREGGFKVQIGNKDNSNVRVLATRSCDETAEDCGRVLEEEIMTLDDLDGLFITGLWGLQAACTCEGGLSCTCDDDTRMPRWKTAAMGKLKTISYDTLPFELTLMKTGYLSGLISQSYRTWGYESVKYMFEYITQGPPPTNFISAIPDYLDPTNVADAKPWGEEELGDDLRSVCESP